VAVPPEEAERRCRRALMEAWTGRETAAFRLPPSRLALDPGDVVALAHDARQIEYRIVAIADAEARGIEAVRQDREDHDQPPGMPRPATPARPVVYGAPEVVLLDLPQLTEDQLPHRPFVAAHALPWPGEMAVWRSPASEGFELLASVGAPARIGRLVSDLPAGPASRFDRGNAAVVELFSGTLESVTDLALLGGANRLVDRHPGLALTHFRCSWVSCGTEHSRAEEVELGSTVHLTFDELQLGDVALGRAVGPWEAERGGDSRLIGAQPASEAGHGTGGGIVKPGFEAVRVTPPDHCLEPVEEMAGRGENGNGVLDDRNGDRVFPGEVIELPGEHHRDLPCGGAVSGTGRRRRLGAAPTISPFRDDAQATAEAAAPESSPEFGAVPAAARPSLIELDEPGLERTRADAEDVVAFAAQDAADGLPAAAGPNNDLLDRHALVRQRPNGRIRLLAAQEAVVLQPLSRGQQLRTDLPGAERPADRGHRPLHCVEEGSAGVLHQVPAVGDLRDLRGGADDRLTVAAAAVAQGGRKEIARTGCGSGSTAHHNPDTSIGSPASAQRLPHHSHLSAHAR
jgi:hypothetical protein